LLECQVGLQGTPRALIDGSHARYRSLEGRLQTSSHAHVVQGCGQHTSRYTSRLRWVGDLAQRLATRSKASACSHPTTLSNHCPTSLLHHRSIFVYCRQHRTTQVVSMLLYSGPTHTPQTQATTASRIHQVWPVYIGNIPVFTRNQEINMSEMPVVPVLGEEYTRPVVTGQFPSSITCTRTRSPSDLQLNLHSHFRLYFVYFLTTCTMWSGRLRNSHGRLHMVV
jgi:hypothetical protein